jgi:hypothetical protein
LAQALEGPTHSAKLFRLLGKRVDDYDRKKKHRYAVKSVRIWNDEIEHAGDREQIHSD